MSIHSASLTNNGNTFQKKSKLIAHNSQPLSSHTSVSIEELTMRALLNPCLTAEEARLHARMQQYNVLNRE